MSKRARKPQAAAAKKKPEREVKHKKAEKKQVRPEREEKAEEPKAPEREEAQRPKAPMPCPGVSSRHAGEMMERRARGYSLGELKGAAFPVRLAMSWSVPVDIRRRSVIDGNVRALKKWFVPAPKAAPPVEQKNEPRTTAPKGKTRRKKAER